MPCQKVWVGVLIGLVASTASADAASIPPTRTRIDRVLVYSTQARVFRSASVRFKPGARRFGLTDLPETAAADSVRVTCTSAAVYRVELVRTAARLPRQDRAKEVLARLERQTDRLEDLQSEQRAVEAQLTFVRELELRSGEPSSNRDPHTPDGLHADAWRQILAWMEKRSSKARKRLAALAARRRALRRELHKLKVEARELSDASRLDRPTQRVFVTLRGRPGRHRVVVSYRVNSVRWVPSYDLRYDPRRRVVEAAYYAVVKQSSGEDWTAARLQLSTGRPTQLLALPELPTWTLGRDRDFTPTPRARNELAARVWTPPTPSPAPDPVVAYLRRALAPKGARPAASKPAVRRNLDPNVRSTHLRRVERLARSARAEKDIIKLNCLNDKLLRLKGLEEIARRGERKLRHTEDSAVRQHELSKLAIIDQKLVVLTQEAEACIGEDIAFVGETQVDVEVEGEVSGAARPATRKPLPTEPVPWSDAGYHPPAIDRDLPEAAAGGYRFTLHAPGRHSVTGDGRGRRIPLFKRELHVDPVHHILPGLSKAAYLVAWVKNVTGRPILRGHANLFAGTMFSGRSWLNTALPGRTINLPLGVDDSVKVARNVRQRTVVKGVLFKDDVTEYTVEVEVANHRTRAVQVRLEDQIPVALEHNKVEVRGFSASPAMKHPDALGRISWSGRVPASSVKKLRFSFRIVRPKDWELRQHDD